MASIIGLHGVSGVGKDTLVNAVRNQTACVHMKFAAPLRAIVYTLRNYEWDAHTVGNKDYEEPNGVTDALVSFNEVYRHVVPDLMVRGFLTVLRAHELYYGPNPDELIVVSDVRQLNERACIEQLGGWWYT